MTKGLGYAPTGKSKTIPTPDVQKNSGVGRVHVEPVVVTDVKPDTNPVKGTRAARKQKPVTWY